MKKLTMCLWVLAAFIFMAFIGLMSYWYPVTLDEYFRWGVPLKWEMIKDAYLIIVPRISFIFGPPIFALGKWSFVLLNPLVQLANCLCIFYIIFVHLPDIKSLKDMPFFITILFMSIFFVCSPTDVLFWLSGALNYSWIILFFLLMLCFLRQLQTQKLVFKDNWILKSSLFILGFIVGMSNEALAPIALVLVICFGLFCGYKKIKTPRALSFLIFGVTIGCLVFFSAPAHYSKMGIQGVSDSSAATLWQKLFSHILYLDEFFKAQFYIFILTALFLIVAFLDKTKRNLKQENLLMTLLTLLVSFIIAFILFIVPEPPLRACYPASILCIISFLFLVRYYTDVYRFDISKILCYFVLIISLVLLPRFVLPNYVLHLQENERNSILQKKPNSLVYPYTVLAGPTENLSIGLMDPARRLYIGNDMYISEVSPLINW